MKRVITIGLIALAAVSCQLPQERIVPRPLPAGNEPVPYADHIQRARTFATMATEAFYADRWPDLAEAAQGLAQTAGHLPKSTEVPAKQKANLDANAAELGRDAAQLTEAVKAKNDQAANTALQRIHLKVRALRPE